MSGKRWLLVLAVAGAILLGASGVLLLVLLPRYVESKVLSVAESQGVTLKPEQITFGWGWVQLTQVKVSFQRVRTVDVQVGRIDVTLDGFTPLSIELSNVEGRVTGSITNVGLELSDWTRAHPAAYQLPLSAKNVRVRFVEPADAPPWLEVAAGALTRTGSGGVFVAQQTRFLGVDLGKVGASFAREASGVALGFGQTDLSRAPFRVDVSFASKAPTATFTLAPTPAEQLAKPLGVALPVAGVTVSSRTTLTFPDGSGAGPVTGNSEITLKGYIPPHPYELDGFIFGDSTSFDTRFVVPTARDRIELSESHLQAGRFELRGKGLLMRGSDHSTIALELNGDLPCSALAAVETESRLSKILGRSLGVKAGQFAEKLVGGSVRIGLVVSADTRHLDAARVSRTIGVGCGLRPLSLAELGKLMPLPADLAALLQNLPTLPSDLANLPALPALPALGSALPPLPSGLPALPTGLPQLPNFGAAPAPAKPKPAQGASTSTKRSE